MRTLIKFSLPLLIILMLTAIYSVKYETWQLRREAQGLEERIREENRAIAILRADWAFLSRPDRIEKLAREHLGMAPAKPSQIVVLDN